MLFSSRPIREEGGEGGGKAEEEDAAGSRLRLGFGVEGFFFLLLKELAASRLGHLGRRFAKE